MRKKIFTFLQKNYGWIVIVITGISIVGSFVLKFIKYIYSILYFTTMVFHTDYLTAKNLDSYIILDYQYY